MANDHLKKPSRAELEMRIAETQASLSNKVTAIASELQAEVKGTLGRVADQVETSVAQVSGTLESNIQRVTDQVHDTVTNVKAALDVPARVQAEPLKMLGIATLAGGVLGLMAGKRRAKREVRTVSPAPANSAAGPAALIGLAATMLKPMLIAATREMVSRRLGAGAAGGSAIDTGGGVGGSSFQSGPVYHS